MSNTNNGPKARFGVKGHTMATDHMRWKRLHWNSSTHKKRLKLIRKLSGRVGKYDNQLS